MSDQGEDSSRNRRLLRLAPLIVALLALAWALGSLPRSQAGGSWLLNSYWLLYLIILFPVIALVGMVVLVLLMAYYWKDMSGAIGMGMARRRKQGRRGNQLIRVLVFIATWSLAIAVYSTRNTGAHPTNSTSGLTEMIVNDPGNATSVTQLSGAASVVSGFIRSDWFFVVFLGLIVVSSLILARGFKVSTELAGTFGETEGDSLIASQGIAAVQDAIKIVQDAESGDPRQRIVACYERMIHAAVGLGAKVTPDLTARELERSIRNTFLLREDGIKGLTELFEEARYSLHPMTEDDSNAARSSLQSIEKELKLSI